MTVRRAVHPTPKTLLLVAWVGTIATLASIAAPLAEASPDACVASRGALRPVVAPTTPASQARAQQVLRDLVQRALERSDAIGAASVLAAAANDDLEHARAGALPRAVYDVGAGRGASTLEGLRQYEGDVVGGTLTVTAPLYDGGRVGELVAWRGHLADAARLGQLGLREQIALRTVALALDRSRYFKQGQVYRQHVERLECLVGMLERIVRADGGRLSELVQARKTRQEAQLAQRRAHDAKQRIEHQLVRFVGSDLPELEGMTALLDDTPARDAVLAAADHASDIARLSAEAEAADAYARSLAADRRPQVDWNVNYAVTTGVSDSNRWLMGVNIRIPLSNPGARQAEEAARKRAVAARLTRADFADARIAQIDELYEQAIAYGEQRTEIDRILEDSEQLRRFTVTQWQTLGRRSLFDVMSAERDHYTLRIAWLDAFHDRQQTHALLWSLGEGIIAWLHSEHGRSAPR